MASIFDALLDPTGETASTPEKASALAAALKRQSAYGSLGQLMGVQPTQQAGAAIRGSAQDSLKMALAQRQAERESAAAAAERERAEQWRQQNFTQRERGIEATRINRDLTRAGSGPIIDTPDGKVRVTPDNTTVPITDPAGVQVPRDPVKPTEGQSTAGNFARQYEQSLPIVLGAIDKGYVPSQRDSLLGTTTYDNTLSSNAARAAMTDEGKEFYDAAKVLINAVMRRESGAAISASEWQNAFERWLPRPGDSPELIAQKRGRLEAQLGNFIEQAGPAYTPREKEEQPAAPPQQGAPSTRKFVRDPDGTIREVR